MAEAHPPSPKLEGEPFLLRRSRVIRGSETAMKTAMRVCVVLFYKYSIVHCFGLIRNRSILSLIFSGNVVFSSSLMFLYCIFADRLPMTKVLSSTV